MKSPNTEFQTIAVCLTIYFIVLVLTDTITDITKLLTSPTQELTTGETPK